MQATLEKGGSGIFDVIADDVLLFSKKKEGRFPTEDEALNLLEAHSAKTV